MSAHVKVSVRDAAGKVTATVKARIPKKYRRNELDEWHGLTDAWADGLAEGIARAQPEIDQLRDANQRLRRGR